MKSELISDTGLLDVQKLRSDFPILSRKVNGRPLVYFDNAATTQKPLKVINAIKDYYSTINSNVHRGVHHLSQVATDAFEASRKKIAAFIGAANDHEVLFTRGQLKVLILSLIPMEDSLSIVETRSLFLHLNIIQT